MKITIGKNKAFAEESKFSFQIILTKRLSIQFSINKPMGFEEIIFRLKGALDKK